MANLVVDPRFAITVGDKAGATEQERRQRRGMR
jgi:hypothetical protein